jgi:beta-1,2-mannobiose phosphorylase / 1,2-beta-oligomannan phosphorylase
VSAIPYRLERVSVVMEPDPGDPREAWGVLNPAAARDRDGVLYLFPRLVAEGNYSRIGRARVRFEDGRPAGVERLGVVLEPATPEEAKGVEDPRITFIPSLDLYLMTYTAYGPQGPRVAVASSTDLERWERLGLAHFDDPGLDAAANKDAAYFPEPVTGPDGRPAYALLHRPGHEERPGIWVSFAEPDALLELRQHRAVAYPEYPWEALKIGAGPPPVRIDDGWLLLHHGVAGEIRPDVDWQPNVRYSAGAIVLDADAVWHVRARTPEPLLAPETEGERSGIVPNVVFPTGIDPRGQGAADVYYGMADSRIGVARLTPSAAAP